MISNLITIQVYHTFRHFSIGGNTFFDEVKMTVEKGVRTRTLSEGIYLYLLSLLSLQRKNPQLALPHPQDYHLDFLTTMRMKKMKKRKERRKKEEDKNRRNQSNKKVPRKNQLNLPQ